MEMIDCELVMRQLWDYLDGELTCERSLELASHITACQRCYPQVAFERAFLDLLASARRGPAPSRGLRRRVLAALQAEGLEPPPAS